MSVFSVSADVPFGVANVSQIYASQQRGDLTVFSLSWEDGGNYYDGYVAMRHLADGLVEFGAPLVTPTVEWGPHFVYDDLFVDTKNAGAANGLVVYRINPDLSIDEVGFETTHNWISPPLVNLVTHEVFNYSDNGYSESYCHKSFIAPDGTIGAPVQTWSGTGEWDWAEECTRIDDTTFVDSVYHTDYPVYDDWYEDLVFLDLSNGGAPTIGTLNPPSGMPAGGGWNGTIYVNSTAMPTSSGHCLIKQNGGGMTLLCEMRRNGNTLEVVNTFDPNSKNVWQNAAYWSSAGKVLLAADSQTPPYPGELLHDIWGVDESYAYNFTSGRSLTGTAPTGPAPDGGFFVVHENTSSYPYIDAQIRVFYVPQVASPNRIGWGYLAQ